MIIKPIGNRLYQWCDESSNEAYCTGSIEELALSIDDAITISLIAPAEQCTIQQYSYDASESKVLRQTLPYSLEDRLLDDVDELHFSLGDLEHLQAPVAIIKASLIQAWLDDFQQQGLTVDSIVPEVTLLPWLDNQWTIVVDDASEIGVRYIVRYGKYHGFSFSESMFSDAISLLIKEQGLPDSIVLYCSQALREGVSAQLPEDVAQLILWQANSYWSLVVEATKETITESVRFSLLQGDFARSLPWLKWWMQWRNVAALLGVVIILQLSLSLTENSRLESKNLALRTAIEQAYRQAIPKGAVIDAEKQLRRKVNAMQGGSSEGFISLLSKVAFVTEKLKGFEWQVMNYSEKQSEMRITVLAQSFNDVENVRAQLQKIGLKAELTGSSSEKGKTRARLRVRG